jgi:hypothetical protein
MPALAAPGSGWYQSRAVNAAQIHLTGTSYVVLALVRQLGGATPYELKRAMERSTQSIWQVSHTTAYEAMTRCATGRSDRRPHRRNCATRR